MIIELLVYISLSRFFFLSLLLTVYSIENKVQPSACAADFVHSETVSFLCVSHKSMGQFMAAARKTLSPNAIQLFHYSNGMSGLCPFDAGTGNNENTCTQSLSDSNERFFFRFSIECTQLVLTGEPTCNSIRSNAQWSDSSCCQHFIVCTKFDVMKGNTANCRLDLCSRRSLHM